MSTSRLILVIINFRCFLFSATFIIYSPLNFVYSTFHHDRLQDWQQNAFSKHIVTRPQHLDNHSKFKQKLNASFLPPEWALLDLSQRPSYFFTVLPLNHIYKCIKQGGKSETWRQVCLSQVQSRIFTTLISDFSLYFLVEDKTQESLFSTQADMWNYPSFSPYSLNEKLPGGKGE